MTKNGSSLELNDLYFTRFYLFLQFFDATKGLSNGIVYNRMNSLLLLPLNFFHFLKWNQLRNYLLLIFLIVRKSILEFHIIWSIYRISSFCKHIPISREEFLYQSNKCFYCLSNNILRYLFTFHCRILILDIWCKNKTIVQGKQELDLFDL